MSAICSWSMCGCKCMCSPWPFICMKLCRWKMATGTGVVSISFFFYLDQVLDAIENRSHIEYWGTYMYAAYSVFVLNFNFQGDIDTQNEDAKCQAKWDSSIEIYILAQLSYPLSICFVPSLSLSLSIQNGFNCQSMNWCMRFSVFAIRFHPNRFHMHLTLHKQQRK